jgi:hypothetical protein
MNPEKTIDLEPFLIISLGQMINAIEAYNTSEHQWDIILDLD